MKTKSNIKKTWLGTLFVVVLVAAAMSVTVFAGDAEAAEHTSKMYATAWSLVPPLVAIILALITKEVYSSLFIGIVVGGLFYANFSPKLTYLTIFTDITDGGMLAKLSDSDNVGILIFLVILGIMVALMNKAGGSAAYGRWAVKAIKTRKGALLSTFLLGVLVFVDDYFNCLTVGSVMRPVTDTHKVSRAKLAYIIDATAAPICIIAPISSWAAAVAGVVEGVNGLDLFIRAIPYNFYSLLTFVFIITLTLLKFDYGPMRGFEERARNTGDLSGSAGSTEENANPKGRVIDLVIPVIMLIILCTIGMLYVGGFFGADTSGCTDYAGDFIGAFGNTDAFVGLPWGGIIALVLTVIYLVARRVVGFREAMGCIPKGFQAMISPIIILTLAVSLKTTLNALGAADYVHDLMYAASEGLYNMLPAVIFLVACVLAFASGTSWGTFGILIPIVTAIFPSDSALLYIGISACCAGAVCGDHCSPISDTTIMASAGAHCSHVNHVSTQLPYAITAASCAAVCYVITGLAQAVLGSRASLFTSLVLLAVAIVIELVVLSIIRARTIKKTKA